MHIQLQRYDPQIVLESSNADRAVDKFEPFGDDGMTFSDLFDLVNPLQHIPIVGSLYRKFTGDTIDPAMRVAGGALFGGPLGVVVSMASLAVAAIVKPDTTISAPETTSVAQQLPPSSPALKQSSGPETPAKIPPAIEQQPRADLDNANPSNDRTWTSVNEVRRGGWMISYAQGAISNDKDRRDESDLPSINITI